MTGEGDAEIETGLLRSVIDAYHRGLLKLHDHPFEGNVT